MVLYVARDTVSHKIRFVDPTSYIDISSDPYGGEELVQCDNLSITNVDALIYPAPCYSLEQDGYGDYYFDLIQTEADAWDQAMARPAALDAAKLDATTKTWDQLSVAQKKIIVGLDPTNAELGLL